MYLKPMDGYGVWIRGIFYKAGCCFFMYTCLLETRIISGYFISHNTNIMIKAVNWPKELCVTQGDPGISNKALQII